MNILYINDYYFSPGGSSIANQNLCKTLTNKGFNVSVITSSSNVKKKTENVFFLPSLITKWPISISLPLPEKIIHIIRTIRPNLIHLQCLSPLSLVVLFIARKYNIPVIAGIHDLPRNISIYFPKIFPFINYCTKFVLTKFFNRVNVIVSPSLFAKKYYRGLGVKKEIKIISNGIKIEDFNNNSNKNTVSTKKLNNDKHVKKILYVGRIMPDKDLDVLIDAIQTIDAICIIVGPFWKRYLKKLKKIDRNKKIVVTGYVRFIDLVRFYHTCDLFIQPCTTELQGIAILEAMASRLPIIGANSGAIPELITDGVNGLLFKSNDPVDLKNKINLLLYDDKLKKQITNSSHEKVMLHSIDKTANDYTQVYDKCINMRI